MLKNLPVQLPRIIARALLRFKSKKSPLYQRVFLHRMHETPAPSFPTHTLYQIIFWPPGVLSTMMVMKKTLLHIDDMVALLRWQWTILSDFIEIIMPLLAHFGLLSQGTRSIFRP